MRNSGSIIGGAVSYSTNYKDSTAGGIAWGTYLIFVAFACTGIIWALLLSPTRLVRRRDGSRVPTSSTTSWAGELKALARHLRAPKVSTTMHHSMSDKNETHISYRPGSSSSQHSTLSSMAAPWERTFRFISQ